MEQSQVGSGRITRLVDIILLETDLGVSTHATPEEESLTGKMRAAREISMSGFSAFARDFAFSAFVMPSRLSYSSDFRSCRTSY